MKLKHNHIFLMISGFFGEHKNLHYRAQLHQPHKPLPHWAEVRLTREDYLNLQSDVLMSVFYREEDTTCSMYPRPECGLLQPCTVLGKKKVDVVCDALRNTMESMDPNKCVTIFVLWIETDAQLLPNVPRPPFDLFLFVQVLLVHTDCSCEKDGSRARDRAAKSPWTSRWVWYSVAEWRTTAISAVRTLYNNLTCTVHSDHHLNLFSLYSRCMRHPLT